MNVRRGLLRIWTLSTAVWIVGVGSAAFLDWRSAATPAGTFTFEEAQGLQRPLTKDHPAWVYGAIGLGVPGVVLLFGFACSWAVRGFKSRPQQ